MGLKWGVRSQVGITYRNGVCCNPVWRELITNPSRTQLLPGHLGSITLISSPPEERIPALCRDFGFIPKNSWSRQRMSPQPPKPEFDVSEAEPSPFPQGAQEVREL